MKALGFLTLAGVLFAPAQPGLADTSAVSPNGFAITVVRDVAAPSDRVFRALGEPGRWWNPEHTWSGHADNLTLELAAGGCFCERWPQGSVEHGRVIYVMADRQLRLLAALGPLQSLPVNAVLDFQLTANGPGTKLAVTYVVAGGGMDLSTLALPVDGVLAEQVDRLIRYLSPR
jgi:uncharacterized protein YndB with AHSA1/START domain